MAEWLTALILANAIDVGTTCVGLQRPGVRDVNPLMVNCPTVVTTKTSLTVVQVAGVRYIEGRGHPTAAKVVAAIGIGVATTGAAVNVTVLWKTRR